MAISYTLYPRMSIAKTTQVGKVWTSILMVMMFNIGDFWGKFTGYYRSSFNSRSIIFLFLTRLFFFFTIPMMVKQFTQEDKLLNNNIFPFFNQVIFAYTGGLIIRNFIFIQMVLSFQLFKKHLLSIKSMLEFLIVFYYKMGLWLVHFQLFLYKCQFNLIFCEHKL